LRVVKVFWGLEDKLAYRRHFPAINWLTSYSLYVDVLGEYMRGAVGSDWPEVRANAMRLLQEEAELEEIARLVGMEALSEQDKLTLESARSIREDFLHQSAFHEMDSYTSLEKQYLLLKAILAFHSAGRGAISDGVSLEALMKLAIRGEVARAKYTPEKDISMIAEMEKTTWEQAESVTRQVAMETSVD